MVIKEILDAENILAANLETELNSISKNISKFKYNKTDLTNDFKPKLKISLTNLKSILPIEIINLKNDGNIIFEPLQKQSLIIGGGNIPFLKPLRYVSKEFFIPEQLINSYQSEDLDWLSSLYVTYKVLGSKKIRKKLVVPNPSYKASISEKHLDQMKVTMHNFPFIDINEKFKTVKIKSGNWSIKNNLVIPKDYTLHIEEGAKIDLINASSIFSKSNIIASGSEKNPIVVTSSDKSGQGIFVSEAPKRSVLNYVIFENLSSINTETIPIQLTGAVTFYKTLVSISNSKFINSLSEDALNIIRSEFKMRDIFVDNSYSDSIDIDFSHGKISNLAITRSGNDGLDFSGSNSQVENYFADDIGDKGLSVGENSTIELVNSKIYNSNFGVVSKDLSKLDIINLSLENCKIGLAAYQKKPEFGSGNISALNVKSKNVEKISFADINSNISLKGLTTKAFKPRVV